METYMFRLHGSSGTALVQIEAPSFAAACAACEDLMRPAYETEWSYETYELWDGPHDRYGKRHG